MAAKYQLVFMGHKTVFRENIIQTFKEHVKELGLSENSIIILDENNFISEYQINSPTVGVYFGKRSSNVPNMEILDKLIEYSAYILPVVQDIKDFNNLVPNQLTQINGFELKSPHQVEPLVSSILECLGLLRLARRLFISYRRKESSSVAIQLHDQLEQAGFDVFLDTHSVRPGDNFQEELWHRLVDTDVVVLLNTPRFLESKWTVEELSKASAMSIGILQLIWPEQKSERFADLSFPFQLKKNDFAKRSYNNEFSHLERPVIENIVSKVESLRARSLASRQDNIIKEFISAAKSERIVANLQPEKFITLNKRDGKDIIVIPTIGVPQAFTYNQTNDLTKRIREHNTPETYLLYDHRNIREKWINHLTWLDEYLPVKSVKITELDKWLKKI